MFELAGLLGIDIPATLGRFSIGNSCIRVTSAYLFDVVERNDSISTRSEETPLPQARASCSRYGMSVQNSTVDQQIKAATMSTLI